jgi:S1-C subfamily serine protease
MKGSFLAGLALSVLGFALVTAAQASKLYKWTDANGQTHYSQTPPPDQSVDYKSSRIAGDVREELRPYCTALARFSIEVFGALRRGVPSGSVISASRSAESRYLGREINQGQLQEVANYVMNARFDPKSDASDIAKRVEDSCLRGTFGDGGIDGDGSRSAASGGRSGTGWFVDRGLVATSLHVVDGRTELSVVTDGGDSLEAELVASDKQHDVAILRVTGAGSIPALPLASEEARIGAEVFTIGFPHTGVMGVKPKLTDGVISSQSGIQDDPGTYQISVPVQAGNSGGPLLNEQGYVVGLVASKLSAGAMYRSTQDLTENVNYAVKVSFVRELARNASAAVPVAASREDLIEQVQRSVVRVIAK